MKKFYHYVFAYFCLISSGQSSYTNQNADYNYMMDRYEILSGNTRQEFHTSNKPYKREDIYRFIQTVVSDTNSSDSTNGNINLSSSDKFNLAYVTNDNWEFAEGMGKSNKPTLKYFYEHKNAIYSTDKEDIKLIVNPVIGLWAGKETKSDKNYNFQNSRGAELRGIIDNKVGFYTSFTDNQAILPMYVRNSLRPVDSLKQVLMGENYVKVNSKGTLDYISARAYVTFNVTKHIGVQFGHDKNFVGNGYRTLVLSENSGTYNFLKLQTKIWKFQYTNLFTQMTATPTVFDSYYPKKYFVLHQLSTNIGKNFNLSLFESVSYGNRGGGLDINYLNPIIFYRSVEQNLGSSDNACLGGDWKLNFMRHFSWYGQVMIDEFLISNVRARNGSWTNKQALQMGLKYFNVFGIKNLDGQAEVNIIRPYTYAHADNFRSYSNYLQPLAHPRGANLKELIGILRYQPLGKLNISGKIILIKQGLDSLNNTLSVGSDVLTNYSKRINHNGQPNTDHKIGQGIPVTFAYIELMASYMVKHNVFLDLVISHRKQSSSVSAFAYNNTFISFGLRMNMARKNYDW